MQGEAPESPSMRTPTAETTAAVGDCFDACATLPDLLVHAVCEEHRHWTVLAAYLRTSKAFRTAAYDAIDGWCDRRNKVFEAYARLISTRGGSWTGQFALRLDLQLMMERAFHIDAMQAYGPALLYCTGMDADVFIAVQRRRCALCGRLMKTRFADPHYATTGVDPVDGRIPLRALNFTFAHERCQTAHCVRLGFPGPDGIVQGRPDLSAEVTAVAASCNKNVCSEARVVASMKDAGVYRCAVTQRERVWVREHPAVLAKATLYGAFDIRPQQVDAALQKQREREAERRAAYKQRRHAAIARRQRLAEKREQLFVLRLAQATARRNIDFAGEICRLPWTTISDIEDVHPRALKVLGVEQMASSDGTLPPLAVDAVWKNVCMLSRFLERRSSSMRRSLLEWAMHETNFAVLYDEVGLRGVSPHNAVCFAQLLCGITTRSVLLGVKCMRKQIIISHNIKYRRCACDCYYLYGRTMRRENLSYSAIAMWHATLQKLGVCDLPKTMPAWGETDEACSEVAAVTRRLFSVGLKIDAHPTARALSWVGLNIAECAHHITRNCQDAFFRIRCCDGRDNGSSASFLCDPKECAGHPHLEARENSLDIYDLLDDNTDYSFSDSEGSDLDADPTVGTLDALDNDFLSESDTSSVDDDD